MQFMLQSNFQVGQF